MVDTKEKEKKKMIYKLLVSLVTPIAFQYLMSSAVSAADAVMLGFLDQNSLSASSLATQAAFVYSLFYGAFISGTTVMASQYYGKKDMKSVEQILAIAMRYALLVGLLFTCATLFIPDAIMRIFTSDQVLIDAGAVYLRTVSLSFVLTGFSQVYFCIMKVCGRAGLSSLIGSLSVVINIFLNAVFIFGLFGLPAMGIAGAALATVFARVFEVVVVLIVLFRGKCVPLRLGYVFGGASKVLHKDYWHYTLPLLFNQLGWGGGITMYSVIMGHLGTDATAANAIANIVRNMIASLCWGIAAGVGIIIGQMLGRGELDDAKKAGGSFVRLSIAIGVFSGLVILALIPLVLPLVSLSAQAKIYLKAMLFMAAYYIIGNSLNSTIIAGIFPAGGDTKFGMVCDLVTLWVVIVPAALLAAFVFQWPVLVVAFILTLDEFVKIPVVYIHYKKYKWLNNITR
ncbi:MAG: MATE family efflux transporter [Lachnospiraceae bacterium]|nr:MATE family efflux transporter [Lachnospiraceae bacterium]